MSEADVKKHINERYINNFVYLALIFVVFFLYFRVAGILPAIMSDEYIYNKFSRIAELSKSPLPNYLYFVAYRSVNLCGYEFYSCVKFLNLVFYISGVFFVFKTARLYVGRIASGVVAVLTMLGPVGTYTSYFMPESMYFFGFWLFVYTFFYLKIQSEINYVILTFMGLILGLLALIKPHALFIYPIVFCWVLFRSCSLMHLKKRIFVASAIITIAVLIKLLFGYLVAGKVGLTLFGVSYNSIATANDINLKYLMDVCYNLLFNISGHISAISLLYGFVILSFCMVRYAQKNKQSLADEFGFFDFAIWITLGLIFITSLFTVAVSSLGESITRLHMRYYNFILPMYLILAAILINNRFKLERSLAIVLCVAYVSVLSAAAYFIGGFEPSFIDNPDVAYFIRFSGAIQIYVLLMIGLALLALYSFRVSSLVNFYLVAPSVILYCLFFNSTEMRNRIIPDVYDKVGNYLSYNFDSSKISSSIIVGSNGPGLYRVGMYVENNDVSLKAVTKINESNILDLIGDKNFAIIIGIDSPAESDCCDINYFDGFFVANKKNM